MNRLEFYSREDPDYAQGFRSIICNEGAHEFASAWWPPGHIIGYGETFVNEVSVLINSIAEDKMPTPDFVDGVKVNAVMDAVANSIKEKAWMEVESI